MYIDWLCFLFVWAETVKTNLQLERLNSSLAQLQSSMDHLQANLTAIQNQINTTLSNRNCRDCNDLKPLLQTLTVDTSITVSPAFV